MDRWLHSLSLVTGSALLIAHSSPAAAQEASTSDELVPIGRGRISAVYDIDVAPPYAFALERELLHVLDVRDPSNVREVAQLPFDGPRVRSVLKGSYLYLYGFGEPIGVIDVSTPTEPRWLGEAPGSASVGMEIVGQMAYLIHNSAHRRRSSLAYSSSMPQRACHGGFSAWTLASAYAASMEGSHTRTANSTFWCGRPTRRVTRSSS